MFVVARFVVTGSAATGISCRQRSDPLGRKSSLQVFVRKHMRLEGTTASRKGEFSEIVDSLEPPWDRCSTL
jgi:hypothetical protein